MVLPDERYSIRMCYYDQNQLKEAKKEYAVDCLTCHGADHVILKHPEIKYEIRFIKE